MNIDRASDIAYAGMDPRAVPAYSIAEAARYLAIPAPTLRRWVATGSLTDIADSERSILSFRNLIEAHDLRVRRQPRLVRFAERVLRDASDAPVALAR